MGLFNVMGRVHRYAVIGLCLAAAVLIGLVRFVTGPELALSLFYLFPVTVSAWVAGRRTGILIACLCALTWLAADLSMVERFSNPLIPLVNEILRLLVFLFAAVVMAAMKQMMEIHRKTARTDTLTGIPNRLSFMEYADIEVSKARRDNRPISLVFLDVDNFKAVNDTWGHHEGDLLLAGVATTLVRSIRTTDFAARLGGDEFAVLLWRSGRKDSIQVARKIQNNLRELVERNAWPVTFSLGLVTCETTPSNVDEVLDEADRLMYQAKHQGKNTLVAGTLGDDREPVQSCA
jgi:diguanylate cyclase (GGDEF)-like protein